MIEIDVGKKYRFNDKCKPIFLNPEEFIGEDVIFTSIDKDGISKGITNKYPTGIFFSTQSLINTNCLDPVSELVQLTTIEEIIANDGKEIKVTKTIKPEDNNFVDAVIEVDKNSGWLFLMSNDRRLCGAGGHKNIDYQYSYAYEKNPSIFNYHKIYLTTGDNNNTYTKENISLCFTKILKSRLKRDEINESYSLKHDLELSDYELAVLKDEINKSLSVDLSEFPMLDTVGDYLKTLESKLIK